MRLSPVLLCSLSLLGALGACKGDDPVDSGGGSGEEGGDEEGGEEGGGDEGGETTQCASGEAGEPEQVALLGLQSRVTWTLQFDEDAEAAGYTDCSYTRDFDGLQVLNLDYDCPDCDAIFRGDASMVEGFEDCFAQISSAEAVRTELWGIQANDTLYRTSLDQFPLGQLTTFEGGAPGVEVAIGWSSESELTAGGTMLLSAEGTMQWDDSGELAEEPFGPRQAAYACGWECNDPGTLTMDYELSLGSTLPNVRLDDACGEAVDLWDFYGSYLIIDTSQADCGPCRTMASTSEEFLAELRGEDVPVRMVTLMGDGLTAPMATPDLSVVTNWIEDYGITDPVLADRGYAYALFPEFIEGYNGDSFGFPAWIIVDPELKLIYGNVGFSDWEDAKELIRADWASR